MDESELDAHDEEHGNSPSTPVSRVRFWTSTVPSQQQESVGVDEAPATPRIVELPSLTGRNHSPPTPIPASARNAGQQTDHAALTNGHFARTSAHPDDRAERARALFARYGVNLQDSELILPTEKPVHRVERSVRMRIRFWCHRCSTQYGDSKICSQCAHQRCNRCVRYPPKKSSARVRVADAARVSRTLSSENLHTLLVAEPAPSIIASSTSLQRPTSFMPQAYTNGGHDSIPSRAVPPTTQEGSIDAQLEQVEPDHSRKSRRPRVRVQQRCHKCLRTFASRESTCSSCGHERCRDCPGDLPRGRHRNTGSDNRMIERARHTFGTDSDDGGDEDEDESTSAEAPILTRQHASSLDTATWPLPPSTKVQGINTQDRVAAPHEPAPPE